MRRSFTRKPLSILLSLLLLLSVFGGMAFPARALGGDDAFGEVAFYDGFEPGDLTIWQVPNDNYYTWGIRNNPFGHPIGTHSGIYIASITSRTIPGDGTEHGWLITEPYNLNTMDQAYLSFWFHNYDGNGNADGLNVYYKVGTGDWVRLARITDAHNEWTQMVYELPTENDVSVGLDVIANNGSGVDIDDFYMADFVPENIGYIDEDGDPQSVAYENVEFVTPTSNTSWIDGWYVVDGEVEINDTVNVYSNVNLILCDGAKLTVNGGICVEYENSLTIYGQTNGTGKLNTSNTLEDESGVTIVGGVINGVSYPIAPQEHVHDYVPDENASTPPTCTEAGEDVYVCNGEGECDEPSYAVTVDPLGHNYVSQGSEAPTCTDQGYTYFVCSRCGDDYYDDFIDALGHDYVYTSNEDGTHKITCSRCDYEGSGRCNFRYKSNGDGTHKFTCRNCSYEGSGSCNFRYGSNWDGTHKITCKNCDYLSSGDCAYEETPHAATCTTGAYKTYTCKQCLYSYNGEAGQPNGHEWEWVIDTEADCGNDGVKHQKCKNCTATQAENTVIPATGDHEWEWVIDTAADCGNDGVKHQKCKNCTATQAENTVIPATGNHTTALVGAKEATATEDGYTGDEVCSVCGQTISTGEVIPATGTPTEPTDGDVCPLCGKTEHSSHRDAVLHSVIYFVTQLITQVVIPLLQLMKG